jgi:predicted nucleotidyltransferase
MDRKKIAFEFAKSLKYDEIEKIILFGSVARGNDNNNSDIDILIITSNNSSDIEDEVYTKVFKILITTGQRISIKMRSNEYYKKYINSSFLSNVEKEGIVLS